VEDQRIRDGNPPVHDPKFANYCARRATLVKKLCMIISVSESSDLIIRKHHFERAVRYMEQAEKKMARVFGGLGQAKYAYAIHVLMDFIVRHKVVTRSQVLRFFFRDIDDYTFEACVRTLERMGETEVEMVPDRRDMVVRLIERNPEFVV